MSYIQRVFHDRLRLEAGVLFLLLMIAGTLAFVQEGNTGALVIDLVIAGVSALLIILPKPDFLEKKPKLVLLFGAILALVIYLCVIPKSMFLLSESVISGKVALYDQAMGLNICLIVGCIFLLALLTQSFAAAFGITGLLCLLFTILNFYSVQFRGTAICAVDFSAVRAVAADFLHHSYMLTETMWETVCYYLLFIVLGFRMVLPANVKGYHFIITAMALLGIVGCVLFYKAPEKQQITEMSVETSLEAGEQSLGAYLYLWMTLEDIKLPEVTISLMEEKQ